MIQWSYNSGRCGGSFTTQNGILTSPSYPENYPNNAECVYTISHLTDTTIMLSFVNMQIATCTWSQCPSLCPDYLEIRDGPSDDSHILGRLCGNEIPAPIHSSQNQMWLR